MKKISLFSLLIGLLLITSNTVAAAQSAQMERFSIWIDILEKPLSSAKDSTDALDGLLNETSARISAFNLQALGKLYAATNPDFEFIRNNFKKIEDNLGAIDKWKTLKNEKQLKAAKTKFKSLLVKEKWFGKDESPRLKEIRKNLKVLLNKVGPSNKDILTSILIQTDELENAVFDFSNLEEGNGLHEFRRKVRWITIEAQVLNGLIQFDPEQACKYPNLEALLSQPVATSKYATLKINSNEKNPCLISRCAYLGLADSVNKFGAMKDSAEQLIGNTESDKTPIDIQQQADDLFADLKSKDIFNLFKNELQQCLSTIN